MLRNSLCNHFGVQMLLNGFIVFFLIYSFRARGLAKSWREQIVRFLMVYCLHYVSPTYFSSDAMWDGTTRTSNLTLPLVPPLYILTSATPPDSRRIPTILTTRCLPPKMTSPPWWQLLQRLLPTILPRTLRSSSRGSNVCRTEADAAVEGKIPVEVAVPTATARGTRIWVATNTSKCVSLTLPSSVPLADSPHPLSRHQDESMRKRPKTEWKPLEGVDDADKEERKPKRKVAVMISYCGSGYKGMQLNPPFKSIEGDLFEAFVQAGAISRANSDDPKKVSCFRTLRIGSSGSDS